jgi:hypothetical protein
MITAEVSHVNADAEVVLEYNSKNKLPTDDVILSEDFSKVTVYSRSFTDTITTTDLPEVGQIHKTYPAHSFSIGDEVEVAMHFNLLLTDAISGISDATVWTIGKNVVDSINTSDTPTIGEIHRVSPTDGVTASDVLVADYDGMLNTNMLNTRVLSVGSLEVSVTDIQIT